MGQHTTDDVYDKVTNIEEKLDKPAPQGDAAPVTTGHFNTKVKELKEAIEKGPKKKEEQKGWKDIVKEWAPVKAFLDVANGADFFGKVLLTLTAVGAGIAALGVMLATIGVQFNIGEIVKRVTLAWTGRSRNLIVAGRTRTPEERQRQYLGTDEDGRWGMQPENTQAQAQNPNLPSVEQINAVRDAMGRLNTEVDTYRSKVRGLATPRAMNQMASAAKKLESAAKKHQNIDRLRDSLRQLGDEFRAVSNQAAGS